MTVFDKLAKSGVKVSNFNNIITIDESSIVGRTVKYQSQDKHTLQMLELISRKLRLLLSRYPKLKD
jgi:hypothetical protein